MWANEVSAQEEKQEGNPGLSMCACVCVHVCACGYTCVCVGVCAFRMMRVMNSRGTSHGR